MKVEAITALAIWCNIRLRDITRRVKLRETTGFRLRLSKKVRVRENITRQSTEFHLVYARSASIAFFHHQTNLAYNPNIGWTLPCELTSVYPVKQRNTPSGHHRCVAETLLWLTA
jgi:hypothetical protein